MTRLSSPATDAAPLTPAARRGLAIVLLAAGLAFVASSARLHEWLTGWLPVAEAAIRAMPALGVSIFVVYAVLAAMLAFVSSAVIVPIGIHVWGSGVSMFLLWLGWILGGVCAYTISRYLGRRVVNALRVGAALERYETRISQRASFGLVLLFQLAVPSEIPGYLLGLLRYSFWKYVSALALAELPYAAATIYIGSSFLERRTFMLVGAGLAVAAFSAWALYTLHRRIGEDKIQT